MYKGGKNIMAIHVEALQNLSPQDFMEISEEHVRLNESLQLLCTTCHNIDNRLDCQSCNREKLATCQGRLVSFFYNVVNFSTSHFKREEAIMLRQAGVTKDDEDFQRHQQAHINMLEALNEIISECDLLDARGKTADAYRNLCNRMSEQFKEHDRMFDGIYLRDRQAEAAFQSPVAPAPQFTPPAAETWTAMRAS
jgi:hemerythrin